LAADGVLKKTADWRAFAAWPRSYSMTWSSFSRPKSETGMDDAVLFAVFFVRFCVGFYPALFVIIDHELEP
jgi:hypothetical protein